MPDVKLACPRNPCASCPYRRDTPPGVWSAEEYRKLPAWDEQFNFELGTFLCHSANIGGRDAVCRGWLEVHHENLSVRLAVSRSIDMSGFGEPTRVPLYGSGAEACAAGLRGVKRPRPKARAMIKKLLKLRARRKK